MSHPGTLVWLARHESRLAWRDWLAMMTAGGRWRTRSVAITCLIVLVSMHLLALSVVGRYAGISEPDKATLVTITGCVLMSWSLMVSQALESVTRAFYTRADLDLILSSPVAARKVFVVRMATMALSITGMALLLAAPAINVLALRGGSHWLVAYGAVVALGASASAVALALAVALFRIIGPRRTRLVAQIVAAVIGAAFVIGVQIAAILSADTKLTSTLLSRFALLSSDTVLALAPDTDSVLWWPARGVLGDLDALAAGLAILIAAILLVSRNFADHVIVATGATQAAPQRARAAHAFRRLPPKRMLRRKEWILLRRDPWLLSQSLMQLLYLAPPALLLWRGFGSRSEAATLIVPVLVMAAGQLAGGLAWLAISGEDAPDLIATAPVKTSQIVQAKIEAVLGAIMLAFSPFVLALALISTWTAVTAAIGALTAAGAATTIQLWFRAQARRSHFRRRQTSSRIATVAEAFSSIAWAATAALAAAGSLLALVPGAVGLVVLACTRKLSPRGASAAPPPSDR
jgi:ABC-2 type transport system permease protein